MVLFGQAATAALAARQVPSNSGGGRPNWAWAGSPGGNGGITYSSLGTPQHQPLPYCLTDNPMPQGQPWGGATASNTNPYANPPHTGVTRYYDWTVSKEPCSPDGVQNTCLLVNGQFPGPLIEANWGDWIQVRVHNNISNEGTAIHWHAFLMKETPWMDGVPGFDQCPIAPGASFTYNFKADLYGTSWYHSHYSSQYGSGLMGPMVIYGPLQQGVSYDADLGPIMVSDYYHAYYEDVVDALLAPLPAVNIPMSDNNLINGKNSFDCSQTALPCTSNAPLASFNFTTGKTYRLRFINPSSAATQVITIDNHRFTVIANDFVPVQPYDTDHLILTVGQRNDVLVKATGSPTDSVWMRGYKPEICWPSHGGDIVQAAVFYEKADRSKVPTSQPGPNAYSNYCGNDPLDETEPYYPIPAGEPSVTEVIPLEFRSNGTNLLWYMANRTMRVDYNDPMLLDVQENKLDFPYIYNTHNYGSNASLRFIVENTGPQPHPMHVHGHNIFVLAEGDCNSNTTVFGNENGTSQAGNMSEYRRDLSPLGETALEKRAANMYGNCWYGTITRPQNPQRRDVQMLLPGQYIVVQWNQDNAGVWPFHCHIAWHLSAGFVWTVIENPDTVRQETQIPGIVRQTCDEWMAWTNKNVVGQIDDGV